MNKSFIDIFVELADEADKVDAKRTAKVLEKNGIDSLTLLINMDDSAIASMSGIGPRSMVVIGKIKTREKFKSEKKIAEYKKLKGKQIPKTFKYYLQRAGCTYLESCNIEHIVKKNGCSTIDDFMIVGEKAYDGWKGIGTKRLEKLIATRALIAADMKPAKKKASKAA